MPKRIDRRVQRTRRLLRDALITLTLERGYDAITIQDITDHANLGRATFYLHYKDKDDLLLSTLQEIVDELLARIGPAEEALDENRDNFAIRTLFQHAQENADLYRIILRGSGAAHAQRRLREIAATVAGDALHARLDDRPSPVPLDLVTHYFSRALLGMVDWWLAENMPYPVEYMADVLTRLSLNPLLAMLEIAPHPTRE